MPAIGYRYFTNVADGHNYALWQLASLNKHKEPLIANKKAPFEKIERGFSLDLLTML